MKSKVRVAFVAGGSQLDRRAWSGTVYYAHRALAERFDVVPIEMPLVTKIFARFRQVMRKTGIDPLWEPLAGRLLAGLAARRIKAEQVDAVFVLGASHMAAGLIDRFALFHCSDTTFANMVDYHKNFSELSPRTVRLGNLLEQKIFAGCWAAFLSSDWAARSARADYGADSRVHVVPFGANLDALPAADVWLEEMPAAFPLLHRSRLVREGSRCRRGGSQAAERARRAHSSAHCRLHAAAGCGDTTLCQAAWLLAQAGAGGICPPDGPCRRHRIPHSPDPVEANSIVFCEAAAHGTPAVARRTGGILKMSRMTSPEFCCRPRTNRSPMRTVSRRSGPIRRAIRRCGARPSPNHAAS